jgi:hypothetical protein
MAVLKVATCQSPVSAQAMPASRGLPCTSLAAADMSWRSFGRVACGRGVLYRVMRSATRRFPPL